MTEADIKNEVRGRLGDPSTAELPDTQLDRALAAALREYSRFKKRDTPISLDINIGQTDYVLPAGTTDVKDVLLLPSPMFLTIPLIELLNPDIFRLQLSGSAEWDLRQIARMLDLRYVDNYIVETQVILGSQDTDPPTLRIYPGPDMDAAMLLIVQKPLTLADLTDEECEHIELYMEGDCMVYIGRKRSKSVRRVPTATGMLMLDDGSDFRKEGEDLKCQFRKRLGMGATVIDAG